MGKKKFAAATFDPKHKIYIIHIGLVNSVALPSSSPLDVHPFRKPQIAGLIGKKAPTKVFANYLNFVDVFSLDLASKLSEYTGINDHAIKLVVN